MKKYNIVWAIVDSVRHYHTQGDDRSRLEFMDEFSKESIEFKHVITSAPSTVMSISAMMTSLPSFYLGRNYSDFRFDNNFFTTLSSLLNLNGWETRALIMHPDIRDKLRVFDLISSKYWPKGFSHRKWWDNSMILELLKNSLRIDGSKTPNPCFWFLDFNCREDPLTSDIVKESFSALNEAGYTKENTIFILCSDHGYPDPKRGITPKMLKDQNLSHDIFMTEDNIRIPLMISYPGCSEGKKIEEIISTLDLMPTLLDLLDVDVDDKVSSKWHGISLMELINNNSEYNKDRLIRVDARFFGQPGRVSAICGENYKYVYHHDLVQDEFISLENYMQNEDNLLEEGLNENEIREYEKYKEAFIESENQGANFQIEYAIYKLMQNKSINSIKDKPNENIMFISNAEENFIKSAINAFEEIFNSPKITLITGKNIKPSSGFRIRKLIINDDGSYSIDSQETNISQSLGVLVYDSSSKRDFLELQKISKSLPIMKVISMDLNMTLSIHKGQIQRYLKTLFHKRKFFLEEPSLIFFELKKIFKVLIRRLLKIFALSK